MLNIDVMNDASEIVHYDVENIPIYIRKGYLSMYPDLKALAHWHDDIELIYIYEGTMYYQINNMRIHLEAGDFLIVNSRNMHYGYSENSKDCFFLCILFKPEIFYGNKELLQSLVTHQINQWPEFYIFKKDDLKTEKYVSLLRKLMYIKKENQASYISFAHLYLHHLWIKLIDDIPVDFHNNAFAKDASEIALKNMISFIQHNYQDNISLDEIAEAGFVSRSKCCMVFKKSMKTSPIKYLNRYRLEVASYLLQTTKYSVTQIATSCGFNHLSYFTKLFTEQYNEAPLEYRKKML